MSIKEKGYLDFFGTQCVYIQDDMNYILLPTDEKNNIMRHSLEKNYKIKYSTKLAPNSIVSVKQQISSDINSICLELNYIFKGNSDGFIDGFIMVGNEVDQFFSPLEHYFRIYRHHKDLSINLLYEQDIIAHYSFLCEGKTVDIELVYGNILREGIRSDMVLHPQLVVTFEKTKNFDFIFHVLKTLIVMLQFVHRKQNYNIKNIQLFKKTETGISYIGYMFESLFQVDLRPASRIDASFIYYGERLGQLLTIIASEPEFPINHLNKEWSNDYSYSSERLGAVSSAFEYEYKKNPVYSQNSEIDSPETKKTIIDFIKNLQINGSGSDKFLEIAASRISDIGKQPGLKQQIVNAYMVNAKALETSIDNLLPRFDGSVWEAASLFAKLRGKVLHNEMGHEFDDKETECIRFISVLQFVMTLKRAQYLDSDIELIIGAMFMCNDRYWTQLTEDTSSL